MSQMETTPQAEVVPTKVAENGSSVEFGYTVNDPLGPTASKPEGDTQNLLAGKFKSQEELEKAYKELEAKLGGNNKPDDQQQQEEQPKQPEIDPNAPKVASLETTDEATAMLQEKGLDITTFTREFETTGQLSEASYTALEAKGIPRDMVNAYIEGQRVLVDTQVTDIKNSVGGAEEYQKIITWAATALSKEDQQAYDSIMATSNVAIIKMAAAGLKSRYEEVMGRNPTTIIGGSASGINDGAGRYESTAQMMKDMSNPLYTTDPAFRKRVEQKVINSNL